MHLSWKEWTGVVGLAWATTFGFGLQANDPPAPAPRLTLVVTNAEADVLSWPDSADGYYLEASSDLQPPTVWRLVDAPVEVAEGVARVALPKVSDLRCFQLRRETSLGDLMLDYGRKLAADLAIQIPAGHEYPDIPFLDSFEPHRWAPLAGVPRTSSGGFPVLPGLWEVELQSFCLKTGTPAPGAGDGYLPAALEGPRAHILWKVIRGFSLEPTADQQHTQILLWAIILRTRLDSLPEEIQALARRCLSAEDLDQLDVVARRKEALQAAYAERFGRFLFGPGGMLEELPAELRAAVEYDAEAQAALARATELSYDEIQDLAFAAAPPPIPDDHSREIPYGRWAWVPSGDEPARGYLVRYLVGWYEQLLVQCCVPETITVEADDLGRITRLADLSGNEIQATYDLATPPLLVAGDLEPKGYAFGALLIQGPPNPEDPRELLEIGHQGVGWVFTGTPAGGGTPASSERFPDATARYAWALDQKVELQRLDLELTRVHPARLPGSPESAARLMNLAQFAEGLRQALLAAEPEDSPEYPYLADRVGLAYRAWVSEFARYCEGGAGPPASAARASRELAGGRKPGWFDRLRGWLSWGPRFQPGQPVGKPPSSSGQTLGYSSKVTPTQKQAYVDLNQQYQQALGPIDKLLSLLPLPNSLKLPRKVIDQGISWNLNLYQYAGQKLAAAGTEPRRTWLMSDRGTGPRLEAGPAPAGMGRADYDTPTVEHVWDFGPIEAEADITPRRLEATRTLIASLLPLSAHLYAAKVAMDRQLGAFEAADEAWYLIQGASAVFQERAAGAAMWDVADAIESWTQVLREEGVDDPWITRDELEGILGRLQASGFSDDQIEGLRRTGLTDTEIAECQELAADWAPELDGYPLFGSLDGAAQALREFGAKLLQFPVPFDPAAP